MKRVYVCSPLHGNGTITDIDKNLVLAKKLSRAVIDAGHAPYAPHVFYSSIGLEDRNPKHRAAGIAAGMAWLGMSDEVWVFARTLDGCSEGMLDEVVRANKFNLPPKVVFMPECWAEFEAELPKPVVKPVIEKQPLRGANV